MSSLSSARDKEEGPKTPEPDLFAAAANDDLYGMALALQAGQRLNQTITGNGHTPLHTAAVRGSSNFIRAALQYSHCDPWQPDAMGYVAFDHAEARKDFASMAHLYHAMYPIPFPDVDLVELSTKMAAELSQDELNDDTNVNENIVFNQVYSDQLSQEDDFEMSQEYIEEVMEWICKK